MGAISRISNVVRAEVNEVLNQVEDPKEDGSSNDSRHGGRAG